MTSKNEQDHVDINRRLDEIHDDIKKVMKVLFEGNGKQSVMTRLALVENTINGEIANKNTKRAMWVAVISAVGGVAAAAVSLLA